MQFIDLKAQYKKVQDRINERMQKVLEHGIYIMGPEVSELEQALAKFVNVKHCVTMASGTDALLVAMMALEIKPGDEVITTPFTFIATAEMIQLLGAKPVFVDVDPKTYNIDANLIERAITPKTKIILPVNLYGQCADYDAINAIAKKHHLTVIEDAAQSFGASYKNKLSCSLAKISCSSFFPAKPLGCYGDGGACFTDDDNLAELMRKIRNHGQSTRYNHVVLGLNSRLDSLQAAILLAKLEIFPQEIELRENIAMQYHHGLQMHVTVPHIESYNKSIYAQYTILVSDRKAIQEQLQQQNVPTAVHYPVPIHKQPVYAHLNSSSVQLPISEFLAEKVLSLPFHPYLQENEIEKIVSSVVQAVKGESKINYETIIRHQQSASADVLSSR